MPSSNLSLLLTSLLLLFITTASSLKTSHSSKPNPYIIHQFPAPTWVENLAVRSNGHILSTLATTPSLILSSHHPNSSITLLHTFSPFHALAGITETKTDVFHLIASNLTLPSTLALGTSTIFTVDLREYDKKSNTGAEIHEVVRVEKAGLLNGLSTLDKERGLIVAADSIQGALYMIDVFRGNYSVLIQGEEFLGEGEGLGVNGVRVSYDSNSNCDGNESGVDTVEDEDEDEDGDEVWIYFSNTSKMTFNRVSISLSTLKNTSAIQQLNTANVSVDDFALDRETGMAYLADGVENQVYSIPLEGGSVVSLLNSDEEEGGEGGEGSNGFFQPTSVQVARRDGKEVGKRIYVTTAGGLEAPVDGAYEPGGQLLGFDLRRPFRVEDVRG